MQDFSPDPFSVAGKVAVVTGASSGLGERFTRVLHAGGATVVAGARRLERLEALAAELGDRVVPVQCDVAVDDDCARLIDAAGDRLDILVNNAGISNVIAAEDEPLDAWRHVVDVNLTGLFALCQLAGRKMLAQGSGSIVNIASILGLVGAAPIKQASYAATKGAVVNLTRELGCQWARKGVRVNIIAPGWFLTEMTAEDMFGDDQSMKFLERNTPMARGGAEHELDGALLFLASDASTFVTGVTIPVDGGWTAR
jgi:NAD(P)-dependent dehydrogenase (short-subunit alcohol dehydrogenase family)